MSTASIRVARIAALRVKLIGLALVGTLSAVLAQAAPATVYSSATFTAVDGRYRLEGLERSSTAVGQSLDTWNIDVSAVAPGTYGFQSLLDALDELNFVSVSFNSIDEAGVRQTFLFDRNALGTSAVGSGSFTVRADCPLASCVWMDILSTQAGAGGYADVETATQTTSPGGTPVGVYGTATFTALADGRYELDGLERSSNAVGESLDSWNIDVSGLAPGTYGFDGFFEALEELSFVSLSFNSIDEAGVRQTFLFDRNALGTLALGSGSFNVRAECPLVSCVWMDILSTQAGEGGYDGVATASVVREVAVPEPGSGLLMVLGLTAVLAASRRNGGLRAA
jgi:hypothetical protein